MPRFAAIGLDDLDIRHMVAAPIRCCSPACAGATLRVVRFSSRLTPVGLG
jgi:hypothetical protein